MDCFVQGKEETFQFLEAVLAEVIELFPSDYIHIGGDEVCQALCILCINALFTPQAFQCIRFHELWLLPAKSFNST